MDTLEINVTGWPEEYVRLVRKYAEEVASAVKRNGLPEVPADERAPLAAEGILRLGTQNLPPELRTPPSGRSPSGVLEALLKERESGR